MIIMQCNVSELRDPAAVRAPVRLRPVLLRPVPVPPVQSGHPHQGQHLDLDISSYLDISRCIQISRQTFIASCIAEYNVRITFSHSTMAFRWEIFYSFINISSRLVIPKILL